MSRDEPTTGRAGWLGKVGTRLARRSSPAHRGGERDHVELLLTSGLFDTEWYVVTAGCAREPGAAARHFLDEGYADGHTPHPLFDPRYFVRREREVVGDRNPLVAYLEDPRLRRASTHRLLDVRAYVRDQPEARRHPRGVLGHYLEIGAPAGLAPNGWYQPDPKGEPEGLADWLRARRREWVERQEVTSSPWTDVRPSDVDVTASPAGPGPVSVLVPADRGSTLLAATVDSVLDQSWTELEVLVLHDPGRGDDVRSALGEAARTDRRVRLVEVPTPGRAAALAEGATLATGEWLAFARPPARWRPDHLRTTVGRARQEASAAARDVLERDDGEASLFLVGPATTARSLVGPQTDLDTLVVRRDLVVGLGGLDASVHRALAHRLELQLLDLPGGSIPLVEAVGVETSADQEDALRAQVPDRERPDLDVEELAAWHQVVLASGLVDWAGLTERPGGEAGLVSVLIPTYADSRLTARSVRSVLTARDQALADWYAQGSPDDDGPARVEVVVVDNGCGPFDAAVLDALAAELTDLRVVHEPVNRGFALGNSVGFAVCHGEVVVFLNNDTEVRTGWLRPLLEALDDPEVHGAQSLLLYPSGSVQSAGVAFPVGGGVPHILLRGFPVEDAAGIERERFAAGTAAALAMRRRDVIAMEGFDPLFLNGLEDVDLGLRMSAARPGHFVVRPDSVVVHHESKTPGRFTSSTINRSLLMLRWGDSMPADDVRLWGARGFEVTGHQVGRDVAADRRVAALVPVLARPLRPPSVEGRPALRWALKIPSPPGPTGESWDETRLARSLAEALRSLGQEVVVDHPGDFDRASGYLDDVALVLRGEAPFRPALGQLNLAWVVSHTETLPRREAAAYDRVFSASRPWAEQTSAEWGMRIEPLLPATGQDEIDARAATLLSAVADLLRTKSDDAMRLRRSDSGI